MQIDEVISKVQAAIPDASAEGRMEGNHVHLQVISASFSGLSPVKRQQLVYGALQDAISSGVIHAVHMQTATPEESA